MKMAQVYRRFIGSELTLDEAAVLLRKCAASGHTDPGDLDFQALPDEQREKAALLLNAAIQPIVAPYMAGEIGSDAAARQLAPLLFSVGVFALNFDMPSGPAAGAAMARFSELMDRLTHLGPPR